MLVKKIPREQKQQLIDSIQQYFYDEHGEEMGNIAAESLCDFMLQTLGPVLYNQAVKDARELLQQKLVSLEDDLYALEIPVQRTTRR
ncbi:MAG TPA: DUF2164 domain-containing protein [Bacilli bacterium]|nr:DUF2164 domain-containing protein [Bacilli bacterium]